MAIEINHIKKESLNFMEIINLNLDASLNIYNQAVLKRTSSIQLFDMSKLSLHNDNSMILFKIHGEIEGFLIAHISGKKTIEFNSEHFKSLFIESFNILTGKFLTNIDNNLGLMCTLSVPREIDSLIPFSQSKYKHKFITKLDLITLSNTYQCKLLFIGNEKKLKEV